MIRAQEQGGEIPGLIYRDARRRRRRLQSPSDRDDRQQPGVAVVRDRRAQHEVRLSGGFNNPSQTYYFNEVNRVRLRNGVANQFTQVIVATDSHARIKIVRNLRADLASMRRTSGRAIA